MIEILYIKYQGNRKLKCIKIKMRTLYNTLLKPVHVCLIIETKLIQQSLFINTTKFIGIKINKKQKQCIKITTYRQVLGFPLRTHYNNQWHSNKMM